MSGFRHTRPMVGHMSDRGFWHSGARSVCSKCEDKERSQSAPALRLGFSRTNSCIPERGRDKIVI